MLVRVSKRPATFRIGTRSVAETEDGHRWIEIWDYNASQELNFTRAACAAAGTDHVTVVAIGEHSATFEI